MAADSTVSTDSGAITVTAGGAWTMGTNVAVHSATGAITVNADGAWDMAADSTVSTDSGAITVTAGGAWTMVSESAVYSDGGNITVRADGAWKMDRTTTLATGMGDITVNARGTWTMDADAILYSDAGKITVAAGAAWAMDGDAAVHTDSGNIDITARGDATIASVTSRSGDVRVDVAGAQLLDAGMVRSGDKGSITVNAGGAWSMGEHAAVRTDGGSIFIAAQGDATVTSITSESGVIALNAADIRMLERSLIATQGAGSITVTATGDWMMDAQSELRTQSGSITVNADGDLEVLLIRSQTGDVALDSGHAMTVVGDVLRPQVVTGGSLALGTGAGIGGYLFDRLYVDVASVTLDHRGGDVVVSGLSGLTVAGIHSQTTDGWVTMMSGCTGLVETAGAIHMDNGQVARISGLTVIAKDLLTRHQLGGREVYYVANPVPEVSPGVSMLGDFNARLALQWAAPAQGLSSKAPDLSTPMRRLSASDNAMAAFASSVLDAMDAPATTSALLDAAMKVMAQDQARAAAEGDTYTHWDQRSPDTRSPADSAPADVQTSPADAGALEGPKPAVAPAVPLAAPAAPPASDAKLSQRAKAPKVKQAPVAYETPVAEQMEAALLFPPALDFSQLGRSDLSYLPQVAVPVAMELAEEVSNW
jgi:hypothetical protein